MILSNGACSGQPLIAVADLGVDVGVLQPLEGLGRPLPQRLDDLDRVDLVRPAR